MELDRPMGRSAVVVALAALLLGVPAALASSRATLAVGATVLAGGACKFSTTGPSTLSFGAIDPASGTDSTASVDIPFRCTAGAAKTLAWSVSSNDGLNRAAPNAPRLRHVADPTRFLRYSLNLPASGSATRDADQSMTITGVVAARDFRDAAQGQYTDAVVLTIAP